MPPAACRLPGELTGTKLRLQAVVGVLQKEPMAILNVLFVEISGDEYKQEFLGMVSESLRVLKDNPACQYIEAWQHPIRPLDFIIVSTWQSEESLHEWYKSPFHVDLRKRGMQGLMKAYFNRQGTVDEAKSHEWRRPD
jgi:heme-degrading monooxygenase HmoA